MIHARRGEENGDDQMGETHCAQQLNVAITEVEPCTTSPIRTFIEKRLTLVTTAFLVLLVGGFFRSLQFTLTRDQKWRAVMAGYVATVLQQSATAAISTVTQSGVGNTATVSQ